MAIVNRESVFAAAQALVEDGQNPTMASVRERLGGGSFSTISPLLAEWKAQSQKAEIVVRVPVPEALQVALQGVADQAWSIAQDAAAAKLAADREALATERTQMELREAQLIEAADAVDAENEKLKDEIQTVRGALEKSERDRIEERSELTQAIDGLKLEKTQLEGSVKTLETLAQDRKDQLAELNTKLDAERESLAAERRITANLGRDLEAAQEKAKQLNERLENEQAEHAQVKTAKENLMGQWKTEQQKNESAGEKIKGLEGMLEELRKQLDKERQRCDKLQDQLVTIATSKTEDQSKAN